MTSLVVTNTATQTVTPPLTLGYALLNPPAGALIDTNGIITWTPTLAQAPSTNVITTVVSDNGLPSQSASNSFVVVVLDQNVAPVLPSQPTFSLNGLATLVVTNTATEAEIHSVSLTYMLVTAPPNATISANGIITWTPVVAEVPSTNVFTTVVTDDDPLAANAQELSATNTFTVVVNVVHNGPSLPVQTDQFISLPATLLVTNTAIDTDSPPTTLTYALVNPPLGARIDTNGIIAWTPVQAQAPSTNLITTIVSDNGSPPLSATNSFTVTVSGPPLGALYYQNFAQVPSGSPTPWVVEAGTWAVANGMLQGGPDPLSTYAQLFLTNTWSDFSVQAQFQFAAGAYGGGLGARVNPATGAHYAAWIYPAVNTCHIIKFSNWITPQYFLTTVHLPPIGTNTHLLKLALMGNQIAVYYDGTLISTANDNSAPYLTGGVSVDMYTANNPYVLSLASVLVDPLAVPSDYLMNGNATLTVGAPGVLSGDTGVYGTNLSANLVSGPSDGLVTISSNGGFTYIPNLGFSGQDSFVYQANDNQTNLGSAMVAITVLSQPSNGLVLPLQSNQTVTELATLVVTNTATDSATPSATLSYQLVNPPAGVAIDTNGIITWTPTAAQALSTNILTTIVTDNGSPPLSATNSFVVVVDDLNSAPVLPPQTNLPLVGLASLVVTNTATDTNLYVVISYALSGPTNAAIDTNGIIRWTPVAAQVPSTNLFVTVATAYDPHAGNGQQLSSSNSFFVFVQAIHNGPRLLGQPNLTINELTTMVVSNSAIDSDVPALTVTYALVNPPTGAAIDTNGTITWTPTQAQAPSTNTITTVVSDNGSPPLSATNSFVVVVNDLNSVPILPPQTNRTLPGLASLVVTNTATDTDIHVVSISYALSGPTNSAIDTNGIIRWTPVVAQVPSSNVFVTVATAYDPQAANGQQMSASNSFVVLVQAIHNGPRLPTQTNLTINVSTTMVVSNSATDFDIPTPALSYALVNPPTGATIDTNGTITWTPTQAQAPSTNLITTVVSDNGSPPLSATNSFSVIVLASLSPTVSISVSNGFALIAWNSIPGQTYRLQYKAGFDDTNWSDIVPDFIASGAITSGSDPVISAGNRFYRILLVP